VGRPLTHPVPYRHLSLWHETADDDWVPRPSLPGSAECDVAIVGAGFTGLWTAYYLARADPGLRIVVLEQEVAGFGASGRNGGWCSAKFPSALAGIGEHSGRDAAQRLQRALEDAVVEFGQVAERERIDAHYERGGAVVVARSPSQLRRARAEVAQARSEGRGPDALRLLGAEEALRHLAAAGTLGGTYTPHCAAIHPARLVRGLARAVETYGVVVHERTQVRRIVPWAVHTDAGVVRADVVVRATEGYTAALPGYDRALAPVYSLMVATEPLPDTVWAEIGLERRQTFSDGRHLIIYGQRTADGRIAFGGRGAPYHFGSRTRPSYDREPAVFGKLRTALLEMLPQLAGVRFTHAWGGALGVPRDWHASVGLDRGSGLAWAGGYVGRGVGASNLAGHTLADLITGAATDRVTLPWVNHHSPDWEPEPLRWLGVNLGLRAMTLADAEERRTGRPSVLARTMAPLTGGH